MGEWDESVPRSASARAEQLPLGVEMNPCKPRAPATRGAAGKAAGKDGEGAPRRSAAELSKQARDISISEFFAKNRHLLGFDNPSKALLTTVKEGVDNSLDACEEAGILPDVRVEIAQASEARFRVAIQDNGPRILPT